MMGEGKMWSPKSGWADAKYVSCGYWYTLGGRQLSQAVAAEECSFSLSKSEKRIYFSSKYHKCVR